MPHLLILSPDKTKEEVLLNTEPLIIGRTPLCNLQLANPQVSRRHARITARGDDYWIEDLGSANGTLVDGKVIDAPTLLTKKSDVNIGGFQISYQPRADAPTTQLSLIGRGPPVTNQTFVLPRGPVQVGRGGDNSIIIDDKSLSRNHALLNVNLKDVTVEDLNSRNGTYVNHIRIEKETLKPGDAIRFGSVEFKLTQRGNTTKAAAANPLRRLTGGLRELDRHIQAAIAVSVASVIILMFALPAALQRRAPAPKKGTTLAPTSASTSAPRGLQAQYEAAIATHLANARSAMLQEAWPGAAQAFQKVIDADPINREARKGLKDSQDHHTHQVMLKTARDSLDKDQPQEVIRKLRDIPHQSHYAHQAQQLITIARQKVISLSLDRAIQHCSERQWKSCHQAAISILQQRSDHPQGQALLKEAEQQMQQARIVFTPWTSSF